MSGHEGPAGALLCPQRHVLFHDFLPHARATPHSSPLADANLVEMLQQVRRVVVDAVGAGTYQFVLAVAAGQEPDLEANPALQWIRRHLKIAPGHDGERFFTRVDGVKMATPLAVVILLIGIVDIVFAVDSIPAIFAITTDPFIVLTSNVFAILGLRAMYFLLAGMHERFHLLSYGLAIVLAFIGIKMLLLDVYKIPVAWSLAFTVVTLAVTMALSLRIPPKGTPGGAYPFRAKRPEEARRPN